MNLSFTNLVLFFTIYSLIGWFCVLIGFAITKRKLRHRGFLYGPYLPICGFGAILLIWINAPVLHYPWLVFPITLVVVTVLEYFTNWLLEALFQMRWWDYSHRHLQFRGRVCLYYSLLISLIGLVVIYGLQPLTERIVALFNPAQTRVVAALIMVIFVIDLTRTIDALTKLNEKLKNLEDLFDLCKSTANQNDLYSKLGLGDLNGCVTSLREICAANRQDEWITQIQIRLDSILGRKQTHMLTAFPNLTSTKIKVEIKDLRIYWTKYRTSWLRLFRRFYRKILIKTIRLTKDLNNFAQGVSFYKLVWVFLIASVIGFFVETLFCWITKGYIESRQGMLYGPFSQVYGFGGLIMVLILNPLREKRWPVMFLAGAGLGGVYEILCSLIEEYAIGTISWTYTNASAGFAGGRTSLVFMFFWGLLALIYIYLIYPPISSMIERIPRRQGIFFSWLIVVLLSADLALSGLAVNRWNQRLGGIPPGNAFNEFLDHHYHDEMMQQIYPKMQHHHPLRDLPAGKV